MKKPSKMAFFRRLALNLDLLIGTLVGIQVQTEKMDSQNRLPFRTVPLALYARMRATKRLRRGLGRFSRVLRICAFGGA